MNKYINIPWVLWNLYQPSAHCSAWCVMPFRGGAYKLIIMSGSPGKYNGVFQREAIMFQ